MEDSIKWKKYVEFSLNEDTKYILHSYNPKLAQDVVMRQIALNNKIIAIDFFRNNDISFFKKRMSYAAMLYEYILKEYDTYWISFMIKPYTYALLSDNKDLINLISSISLEPSGQNKPAFFNFSIQGLLHEDSEHITKSLNILEDQIKRKKEISISKAHMWCIQGIVDADKDLILKGLRQFELKVNKKRFIENDICEEYISFFPIIYAKIAWMKGLEVDPQSKYMPLELLEVKPLDEYTIPYWFLRDYYRAKGIDWRYSPIHPELQDWDNDPENPNRKGGGFFKKLFG